MNLSIPLKAVASQTLTVTLANQPCRIRVYTLSTGLYFDLYVADVPIALSVICQDRTLLVREAYSAFAGDLFFVDQFGTSDPTYDQLGVRYLLVYQL